MQPLRNAGPLPASLQTASPNPPPIHHPLPQKLHNRQQNVGWVQPINASPTNTSPSRKSPRPTAFPRLRTRHTRDHGQSPPQLHPCRHHRIGQGHKTSSLQLGRMRQGFDETAIMNHRLRHCGRSGARGEPMVGGCRYFLSFHNEPGSNVAPRNSSGRRQIN